MERISANTLQPYQVPQHEEETLVLEERVTRILVYNDDVNTFDHVIDTFIEVLGHDPIQAEQCAYIIHFKGKCIVKSGAYEDMEPLCLKILKAGINATLVTD